jgi:hypothetical protein
VAAILSLRPGGVVMAMVDLCKTISQQKENRLKFFNLFYNTQSNNLWKQ